MKARDAFRANPEALRQALRLSSSDEISEVQAVVISRESEATGFLGPTAVPVVFELAFESLWEESVSLVDMWEKLNTRPDHREAASQFRDTEAVIELAGYRFVVPVLAMEVKV
jgi:hypothetical protein